MRSSYTFCVFIIRISKDLKPLVYKNIVHCKICDAICENPKSNRQAEPYIFIPPKQETPNTYKSVKNEKEIVSLPPATVIFVVVILM